MIKSPSVSYLHLKLSLYAMPIAQIGPWEFELPEGWNPTPNDSSGAYFEDA